jgi:hypothetical protein
VALAELKEGEVVLDLGSGGGMAGDALRREGQSIRAADLAGLAGGEVGATLAQGLSDDCARGFPAHTYLTDGIASRGTSVAPGW